MSADYAEVVVNRPIIQRHTVATEDLAYQEWSEQADTRLKTFHYHIPAELKSLVQPGQMVAVPFRNQELQAVVVALSDDSPVAQTRPISAVLDPQPAVTAAQIELARFLADGYLAPLATCLRYFLPPGADRRPMTVLELIPPVPALPPANLNPLETALFLYLKKQTKPVLFEEVEERVANGLIAKNLAGKRATLSRPRLGPKVEQTVELLVTPAQFDDVLAQLGRSSKQAEILRYLATSDDPLPALETVLAAAQTTPATIQALAERGWIEIIPAQTLIVALPQTDPGKTPDLPAPARQIRQILLEQNAPVPLEALKLAGPAQADGLNGLAYLTQAGLVAEIEEPVRVALRLPQEKVGAAVIALRQTERYAAVLDLLASEDGPVWIGWVFAQTDASSQTLQKLAQTGAIALDEARRWRDPLAGKTFTLDQPPPLTPEQTTILNTILPALTAPGKPFLLHGVTGSGKTEIYLRAIAETLKQQRQVIFLVPEVMLATQIVQRVQARFPGRVAVWHSALSPGERFDTWERVRAGSLPIVVGPRSALFAPLQKVGLIIVDEEHEPAYKQDRSPTFHAREAAIEYARLTHSAIIMGSATPDVVSYRKAQRGEYHLLCLPDRILAHKNHLAVQAALLKRQKLGPAIQLPADNSANPFVALPLPPVEIVDLREELKAGNRSIFSRLLARGIEQTLSAGEQVILFLNRRGTATFVICRDCGHVMACPRCDTTLTYHSPNTLLACHYCGYHTREPEVCPECGSKRVKYFGLGTERVEETLRQMFPQARPIRMDQDTTRQTGSHYILLQQFMEGRANVMIGTQMVAKGLDLPLVTLVGVISADTGLYLPDFRAAERTFQVLMQVAGRAGRSPLGGRVILQTYTPEQPAILAAAGHDYQAFYHKELRFRYEQGYPPFKRLARLTHSSAGLERSQGLAQDLADRLRLWVDQQGFPSAEIIGPAPTFVPRIGSQFSWQILVRAPDPVKILRQTPLPVNWKVDIDPVNLL